jgi:hypothetical protein
MPGARLDRIAARLVSATTLERVVRPILADLQAEHGLALARGRRWAARWMLVRGYPLRLAMGRISLRVAAPRPGGRSPRFRATPTATSRRTVRGGPWPPHDTLLSLSASNLSAAERVMTMCLLYFRLLVPMLPAFSS